MSFVQVRAVLAGCSYVPIDVPSRVCHCCRMQEMTDGERTALAEKVRQARLDQFATKKDAYTAAGLNAATWARIEDGLTVRDDRLVAALKLLWPGASGDWRRVLADDTTPPQGLTIAAVDSWSAAVDRRLDELERQVRELLDRDEGDHRGNTSPIATAGVEPAPEDDDTYGGVVPAPARSFGLAADSRGGHMTAEERRRAQDEAAEVSQDQAAED